LSSNINPKPTLQDAQKSLTWLREILLADFPFESDTDRDAVISTLLTALLIRLLPAAPGFLFQAPIQSSGKTTLIEVVFRSVFGTPVAATPWLERPEEMAKTLFALLREGPPGIVFDNIRSGSQIDSAELAMAMTAEKLKLRVLGVSETEEAPSNTLFAASGNQVTVTGDLITRFIPIKIIPNIEDPSRRHFSRPDLITWLEEHRPETLGHLFSIIYGYLQSRDVITHSKPTRFVDWDTTVRAALIWSGGNDPADLFDRNREEDTEGPAISDLIHGLYKYKATAPFTVKDISTIVNMSREEPTPDSVATQPIFDAISDLLEGDTPDSRRISKLVKGIENRVMGNLKIVKTKAKGSGRVNKYRVIKINERELAV